MFLYFVSMGMRALSLKESYFVAIIWLENLSWPCPEVDNICRIYYRLLNITEAENQDVYSGFLKALDILLFIGTWSLLLLYSQKIGKSH